MNDIGYKECKGALMFRYYKFLKFSNGICFMMPYICIFLPKIRITALQLISFIL
jgi:hypothetical protein